MARHGASIRDRSHVCPERGCAELVDNDHPCPVHGRPVNRWDDRDTRLQTWWSQAVRLAAGGTCERCHVRPAVVAHHIRPGWDPEYGIALCDDCHAAVDPHARPSRPRRHP